MTRVLISGAGIAGPTLAYWLRQYGFEPTIVERAAALRTGGYLIDFWGLGYDVADKMNILPELEKYAYYAKEVLLVGGQGQRVGGFNTGMFQSNLQGRFLSSLRGDLASVIYKAIEGNVETIFGDSINAIEEIGSELNVSFESGTRRSFDLVVGADGLHSVVRGITFGAAAQFEKNLGYSVAAFSADGYQPRINDTYVSYSSPGKQIAKFALRDNRTVFLAVFRDREAPTDRDQHQSKIKKLEAILNEDNWECKQIIKVMHESNDLYLDSASQIWMPTWSKGRVALVGDAAFCPSLLAGQGSALAMAGSYILAGELKRSAGDHTAAFQAYEKKLKPFIEKKQRAAQNFGKWFAPDTTLGIFIRNQITRLFSIPMIGNKFVNDSVADQFQLPDYLA